MKQTSAGIWIPSYIKPGRKFVNVVFYFNRAQDRIMVGFPENFPAPAGFEKIVCRSAAEVDKWDRKMRDQEKRDAEMSDEQREAVEGPMRDYARKELTRLMLNARNNLNREFCRVALQKLDDDDKRRKMKRESFMHIAGFENGH